MPSCSCFLSVLPELIYKEFRLLTAFLHSRLLTAAKQWDIKLFYFSDKYLLCKEFLTLPVRAPRKRIIKVLSTWHANTPWKIGWRLDALLALNLDDEADNALQIIEGISEAFHAKLITVNTYLECNFLQISRPHNYSIPSRVLGRTQLLKLNVLLVRLALILMQTVRWLGHHW